MWDSYLKGFKSYLLLERGLSKNTKEAYLRDCRHLFSFMNISFPNIDVKTLDYQHLQSFLNTIQTPSNDKENTILKISSLKRLVSGIRAFYKYLLIEDIVDSDPTELIELPRLDAKLPVVLSNDEIIKILDSIDKSTYRGAWINLMIEVLYGGGLRISELLNLKINDVYKDQELIKVIGKGDKERWIPLNNIALKQIELFVKNSRSKIKVAKGSEGFIFLNQRGGKLSRVSAFKAIKEVTSIAGIEKNVHPHTFRHSFATELILAGADIMVVRDLMGHSSVRSTEIYTHLNVKHLKETLLLYHPIYNNSIKK